MSGGRTLYSALWHRVEGLRPKVKPGVSFERHVVRGEVWYVARDAAGTNTHRLSAPVYAILMRMDGVRSVAEIWTEAVELFAERAPSQDQLIQVLGQLTNFDLLHTDTPSDDRALSARAEQIRSRRVIAQVQNPLFFKVPLFDPNRFLGATVHLVRPLYSALGLLVWAAVVGWLGTQIVINWTELSDGVSDRLLAPDNLVILVLLYPLIKVVHEFGHAYATRVFGGEVHEIGVMFLVFLPTPYCDAGASAGFARKWQRIAVAAGGMMAELLLAAAAMAFWLNAEPGVPRAIAYNVMIIAGISTLVFNSNPLLRFDAYFILADLIEIPNLAARANRWWIWLVQKHLFGQSDLAGPVTARGEAAWFFFYAPASLAYRLTVIATIALFIGNQYFFVGVVLVVWTVAQSFGWPLLKGIRYVLLSPQLGEHRLRAAAVTALAVAAVVGAVGFVPLPYGTKAQGVVELPDGARVITGTGGTVVRVVAGPGETVQAGAPILELEDPYIDHELAGVEARLAELRTRLRAVETTAPVELELIRRRVEYAEEELAEARNRKAALLVAAPIAGTVALPRAEDLVGSFIDKGTVVAYVVPPGPATVRVAVPEAVIDRVRNGTVGVQVRLASRIPEVIEGARILREVPGAQRKLPSPALAQAAGGPFVMDSTATSRDTTLEAFFLFDLALPDGVAPDGWGERAHVLFDHGPTPLFDQVQRTVRQLFLKRFNV